MRGICLWSVWHMKNLYILGFLNWGFCWAIGAIRAGLPFLPFFSPLFFFFPLFVPIQDPQTSYVIKLEADENEILCLVGNNMEWKVHLGSSSDCHCIFWCSGRFVSKRNRKTLKNQHKDHNRISKLENNSEKIYWTPL